MQAIVKTEARPGAEIQQVAVPEIGSRDVLVRVRAASVCGTDLHIYQWDPWSASRIKPPRIIGHEFCGTIVEGWRAPDSDWGSKDHDSSEAATLGDRCCSSVIT